MHRIREHARSRPATWSMALLLSILVASGCAGQRLPVDVSTAAAVPAEPPSEATSQEPDVAETGGPTEAAPAEGLEMFLPPEGEALVEESPLPGEVVTDSPLDELAQVSPEVEPESLATLERIEAAVPEFDIPIEVNERVAFWLDYYSTRQAESFEKGLIRSGRYMELFRRVFREQGLPLDLIYMAHVESAYKTTAYSRARARGIFQFIAGTGKRYGLRIDYWVDDRLDPEKSARASAAYLRDLYAEFGDWYLALAAYNAGEGKIRRALERSTEKDFWSIARTRHIRRETKNYVPAILAAVLISKEPDKYGFDFEPEPPVVYESIDVDGAADLQVLARCAGSDLETMKLLNPALRRYQTPPHATTAVRVPLGAGEATLAALGEIPVDQRVLYVRHRVRSGDTLYELARRYGVTVSAIQQTNKMGRRTVIRVGQELVIPTVAAGSYPAVASVAANEEGRAPGQPFSYRVRRGESLSLIARRYDTSAAAIAAASGIRVDALLQVGEPLTVVPGVRSASAASVASNVPRREAPAEGDEIVHEVRRGESLSVIARRYGTTPTAIARANGIGLNQLLQIGQPLRVKAARAAAAGSPPEGEAGDAEVVHTVRRGDTLWLIAKLYRTTVDEICARNRISRQATLHPGTKLTVRTR